MSILATALLALYAGLLVVASLQDLRSLRIANALSVAVLATSIAFLVLVVRPEALWQHLLSFFIMLAVGIVLFTWKWLGGGDVKLAAAAASLFDLQQLVWFVVATTLVGGILTMILFVGRGMISQERQNVWAGLKKGRAVPYGVAIAIGAILVATSVIPVKQAADVPAFLLPDKGR